MSTDRPHLIRLDNQEIIPIDRKIVLGRHPGCDYVISINDSNIGISGRHATVDAQDDIAWLEDLGSTNGTWVTGERIAKRTQLIPGDRFQLDRLEFEFRAAVKKAPPPPLRTSTTVAIGIEDLALPSPAPMQPPKSQPVKLTPPRAPAVVVPPTVEVKVAGAEAINQLGSGPVPCTSLLPEGAAAARAARMAAAEKKSALPWPLLLGGGAVALALSGVVIYLLLR
ncbi:MAG: FHA domain-containing protein [Pseudomonadota bacterium]